MEQAETIPNTGPQRDMNDWIWMEFVQWAFNEKNIVDAFHTATGLPRPATSRLGQMIDEATGLDRAIPAAFVRWVTVERWGLDYAPVKLRQEIEAEQAAGEGR